MTYSQQLKNLVQHQAWRRGDGENEDMQHPREIGEAIDYAITVVEAAEQLVAERSEQGYAHLKRIVDLWNPS